MSLDNEIADKRNKQDIYPSKLFSLSDFYLPDEIHEVFAFCRKLVATNEIVSSIVHKLTEAPITDLVYDYQNEEVVENYEKHFEEDLKIRERLLELIFDLVTYSNAFLTYEVPVTRYLISPAVHDDVRDKVEWMRSPESGSRERKSRKQAFDDWYAEKAGNGRNPRIPTRFKAEAVDWKFQGGDFVGKCPITGEKVTFERVDRYYASSKNVRLKRWDPNRIEIHHSEVPGVPTRYYYQLKDKTQKLIKKGDRDHLANAPWAYIVAARNNRNVKIKADNLYHISNVKISGLFDGWGVPRLYSAFKLIWYYMTLLRANEAVAAGKINDLNIVYPESNSRSGGSPDPAGSMSGSKFKSHVQKIIKKHQKDPNFTGISPYPIGVQQVFGKGRMQLISSELQPIIRSITTAMGLPYDMLFGGGNYSQTAVANRIFSAQTGLHRERFNELLDFIVERTSAALGEDHYPSDMNVRLKEHEGPDSMQEKQLYVNLAANNQISRKSMLERIGLEWSTEKENMLEEAKDMGLVSKVQAMSQAKAKAQQQEVVQRSKMRLKEEMQEKKMQKKKEMMQAQAGGAQGAPQGGPQQEGLPGQSGGENPIMTQAREVYQFLQENPGKTDRTIKLMKEEYPQVLAALRQIASEGEQGAMEAPSAEAPGLGAPFADEGGDELGAAGPNQKPGVRQNRPPKPGNGGQGGEVLPSSGNQGAV